MQVFQIIIFILFDKNVETITQFRIATPPKFNYYSSTTHIIQSLKTRADAFSFVVTKFSVNVNINKIEL